MSRLSNNEYCVQHQFLRWAWLNEQGAYAYLSHNAQRQIHDYYQPSKELTDDELIAHRRQISERQPNLPAAAGKAARQLFYIAKTQRQPPPIPRSHPDPREITVRAVVRPEIDLKQLSRALIELAKHLANQEIEARRAKQHKPDQDRNH